MAKKKNLRQEEIAKEFRRLAQEKEQGPFIGVGSDGTRDRTRGVGAQKSRRA